MCARYYYKLELRVANLEGEGRGGGHIASTPNHSVALKELYPTVCLDQFKFDYRTIRRLDAASRILGQGHLGGGGGSLLDLR